MFPIFSSVFCLMVASMSNDITKSQSMWQKLSFWCFNSKGTDGDSTLLMYKEKESLIKCLLRTTNIIYIVLLILKTVL